MDIGFVGLGRMGFPMARNLLAAGHRVSAFNRTASKTGELAALGARAAASVGDAAGDAGVVVTMLSDDAAVDDVVFGAGGVLDTLPRDAIHVSMSTIGVALVDRLTAAHAERGQRFVSAPVFGRPEAATSRTLAIVAAGDVAAVARCGPVFEAIGRTTFNVGEVPSRANVVKLMGNFLLASMLESLGESVAVVRKYDIEAQAFVDVMTEALFPCAVYRSYGARIASEQYTPAGFRLVLGLKDLELAIAAAEHVAVAMPVAAVVRDGARAGVVRGMGDWDWASVAGIAASVPRRAP